jgi:hypothetical protein
MAKRLKLYLTHPENPQIVWFRRPDGALDSLPALRLVAYANFMRHLLPSIRARKYGITECAVDTGTHFSIVAEDLWQRFRPGFVTPLPFDALTPPALRTITVAGGTFPYTLGQLTFDLQDFELTALSVTVIAELARDGGRLPLPLILGLRGGFFDGRRLHAGPDPTSPFGQAWGIENA